MPKTPEISMAVFPIRGSLEQLGVVPNPEVGPIVPSIWKAIKCLSLHQIIVIGLENLLQMPSVALKAIEGLSVEQITAIGVDNLKRDENQMLLLQ